MTEIMNPGVICTVSGIKFDLKNPDPDTIHLSDILHALAKAPRFTGHTQGTDYTWNVALHSILVRDLVGTKRKTSPVAKIAALVHDFAEAYTGDISSPLKGLLGDGFKEIENSIQSAILKSLGLDEIISKNTVTTVVKWADTEALNLERTYFLPHTDWWPSCPEKTKGLLQLQKVLSKATPADENFPTISQCKQLLFYTVVEDFRELYECSVGLTEESVLTMRRQFSKTAKVLGYEL